jgi:putative NADH-flavin reductase
LRLAVFGATGRAGRVVVERALRTGHQVAALTRDPSRLRSHAQLQVIGGDVRDASAVSRALDGADAIVSTLGGRLCAEGIRSVLSVAAGGGPRRLVVLSNYGVADSRHRTAYVAVSWLVERAVLRDKEQMEALVRASGADWTVVRAPVLTNGPHTGAYRTGTDLRPTFTSRVSRADLAEFMLTEVGGNAFLRRAVTITS